MCNKIDNIVKVLSEMGIKLIVSIDDEWAEESEQPIPENILELDLEKYMENKRQTDLYRKYEELLEEHEIEKVKDLLVYEKSDCLDELKAFLPEKNTGSHKEALKALSELCTEILTDKIPDLEFKYYSSVDEMKEDIESLRRNTFYFIDKEMKGEKSDSILEIIKCINEKLRDEKLTNAFLVYSSTDLDKINDHQEKINYLKTHEDNKEKDDLNKLEYLYLIWGINKTQSQEDLLDAIDSKIEKIIYGENLFKLIRHKLEIEKKAYENLYSYDLDYFDKILDDAYFEGEDGISLFNKFIKCLKKHQEFNDLNSITKNYEKINNYTNKRIQNRNAFLEGGEYDEKRKDHLFEKIEYANNPEHNIYLDSICDYKVNKLYKDIYPGDVFLINNKELGVIISRECDSVIRCNRPGEQPTRKNLSFKLMKLKSTDLGEKIKVFKEIDSIEKKEEENIKRSHEVCEKIKEKVKGVAITLKKEGYKGQEFSQKRNEILENDIPYLKIQIEAKELALEKTDLATKKSDLILAVEKLKKLSDYNLWPVKVKNKNCMLEPTNNLRVIDSELLDLCSINNNGEAIIKTPDEEALFYKSYHSSEYFENSQFHDRIRKKYSLGDEMSLLDISKFIGNRNDINFDSETNKFDLKRIGRLQSKRTKFLSLHYISHFIKPGVETLVPYILEN